jgi:hypothetical protein
MEAILRKQIEELEKLVRIQNEVIMALKSQQTVQIQYVPYNQQYYQYPYYYSGLGGAQCISGQQNQAVGAMGQGCNDGGLQGSLQTSGLMTIIK